MSPARREAWLAHTREQLFAPVHHLVESCTWLRADAAEAAGELTADLDRIRTNAEKLRDLVVDLLATGENAAEYADDFPAFRRRIGHELRSPASIIIMACDLLREDGSQDLLAKFGTEIDRIRRLAERVVASISEMVYYPFQRLTDAPPPVLPGFDSSLLTLPPDLFRPTVRGRILLADDNPDNREYLSRCLTRELHQVVAVEDGTAALAALRAAGEAPFDLVLLDILMPGMNGYRVLQELKSDPALRDLPVVMISALGAMESVVRCIELGAEDFIPKPSNPVLLRARINACLEKKRLRDREQELLHAIFPAEIVDEFTTSSTIRPRRYERVGVMFLDVVGFTPYCEARSDRPEEVVDLLQRHVLAFEESARRHGVQKIKTIGDAFMAVAGLVRPDPDPVASLVRAGLDMLADAQSLGHGWNLRVGIHCGPVVAGVLGRSQFAYDLWGNTVNLASRMETASLPGRIALSEAAWAEIASRAEGECLERIIRGVGLTEVWVFQRWRESVS
jgi:class 3 adenylate cyclase